MRYSYFLEEETAKEKAEYCYEVTGICDKLLQAYPDIANVAPSSVIGLPSVLTKADVILSVGGDGTLLKTIHKHRTYLGYKKFLGIAAGTANFLTNDFTTLEDMDGKVEFIPCSVIDVQVVWVTMNGEHGQWQGQAINDVVIGNSLMDWINFDVEDKEKVFGNFNGTGLIVSTAVGSTGYNRNNGGVVLPLSSMDWAVTGIATSKKIHEVVATEIEMKLGSRTPTNVWLDGNNHKIQNAVIVKLTRSPILFELGFINLSEYREKRRKIKWDLS